MHSWKSEGLIFQILDGFLKAVESLPLRVARELEDLK